MFLAFPGLARKANAVEFGASLLRVCVEKSKSVVDSTENPQIRKFTFESQNLANSAKIKKFLQIHRNLPIHAKIVTFAFSCRFCNMSSCGAFRKRGG